MCERAATVLVPHHVPAAAAPTTTKTEMTMMTAMMTPTTTTMTTTKLCRVCGEEASGLYFGALVCLPCKSFYIRSTRDGLPAFQCQASSDCDITKASRLRCQACRFQKCLAVGMSRKEKPTEVTPQLGQDLCAVCGDIANGVHFGRPTCEGCKKFFRQALKDSDTYSCLKDKNCPINPRTRNTCRYCRYLKALCAGMSREAIKMGRPKKTDGNRNNPTSIRSKVPDVLREAKDVDGQEQANRIREALKLQGQPIPPHQPQKTSHLQLQMQHQSHPLAHSQQVDDAQMHAKETFGDYSNQSPLYKAPNPQPNGREFDWNKRMSPDRPPPALIKIFHSCSPSTPHQTIPADDKTLDSSRETAVENSTSNIYHAENSMDKSLTSGHQVPTGKENSASNIYQKDISMRKSSAAGHQGPNAMENSFVPNKRMSPDRQPPALIEISQGCDLSKPHHTVPADDKTLDSSRETAVENFTTNIHKGENSIDKTLASGHQVPTGKENSASIIYQTEISMRKSSAVGHQGPNGMENSFVPNKRMSPDRPPPALIEIFQGCDLSKPHHTVPADDKTLDSSRETAVENFTSNIYKGENSIDKTLASGHQLPNGMENSMSNIYQTENSMGNSSPAEHQVPPNDLNYHHHNNHHHYSKPSAEPPGSKQTPRMMPNLEKSRFIAHVQEEEWTYLEDHGAFLTSSPDHNILDSCSTGHSVHSQDSFNGGTGVKRKNVHSDETEIEEFDKSFWLKTYTLMGHEKTLSDVQKNIIGMLCKSYQTLVFQTDEELNKTFTGIVATSTYYPDEEYASEPFRKHIRDRIVRNTHSVVAYIKSLPGHHSISSEDLATLCRSTGFNVSFMLSAMDRFLPEERSFKYFWNWKVTPQNPIYEYRNQLVDHGEKVHYLQLDNVEKALFLALILISPDWAGLREKRNVETLHDIYFDTLKTYLVTKGEESSRLQSIMSCILPARKLSVWHNRMTVRMAFQFKQEELTDLFQSGLSVKKTDTS